MPGRVVLGAPQAAPCCRGRGALAQGCTARSHQQRFSHLVLRTRADQGGSPHAPDPDLGQNCSSERSWPGGRDRRGRRPGCARLEGRGGVVLAVPMPCRRPRWHASRSSASRCPHRGAGPRGETLQRFGVQPPSSRPAAACPRATVGTAGAGGGGDRWGTGTAAPRNASPSRARAGTRRPSERGCAAGGSQEALPCEGWRGRNC